MFLALVPLLLMASGQAPPPQQPPTPPAPAVQQRPASRPQYDEKADAQALIAAAVAAAAEDDIRVLINWGANDDPRCAAFQTARRDREVADKFSDEFRLVSVDVGHADKNLALAERYGMKLEARALPAFTVLDAKGAVVAQIASAGMLSASEPPVMDPKALAAALTKHQTSAPPAQPLFDAALAEARRQDKLVFVWFSAPW
jgi:hypothetical protein